jgi:hypothetical protein
MKLTCSITPHFDGPNLRIQESCINPSKIHETILIVGVHHVSLQEAESFVIKNGTRKGLEALTCEQSSPWRPAAYIARLVTSSNVLIAIDLAAVALEIRM